ncbi:hypothetical protein [Rhizorhabdus argentea]|uniref:hypothetical protein n=1 Tax=Rhizorhabdus argentea TaxID=1387174 RepID=UPI0030ED54DD
MARFTGTSSGDIYTGGVENDDITGNGGDDRLSGNAGNDTIEGDGGADNLAGGDGDDQLFSHTRYVANLFVSVPGISYDVFGESDTLMGGNGDDYIFAGYGDVIDGGAQGSYGNRLFISFQGSPDGVTADFRALRDGATVTVGTTQVSNIQTVGYLEGSNFDDVLVPIDTYYPTGPNVYGRGGNDSITADYYSGWGGSGIWGGDGNDTIDGTTAQYGPKLYGEAGDDVIRMRSALGVAYGGDGNDTISAGGEVHGGNGNDRIDMLSTYYTAQVYGDEGNDVIIGVAEGNPNDYGNTIAGGSGADTLSGGANGDILASGDFLANSSTATPDMGVEHDVLNALAGNDSLSAGIGDDVDGGDGNDVLSLSLGGAASGVTIDLTGIALSLPYSFAGGTIQHIETLDRVTGSAFADAITVGRQESLVTIDGGDGADMVTSADSSVAFNGGTGDDRFVSGIAGDRFDGGSGFDTVDYGAYSTGVTVALGATSGAQGAGAGGDVLISVEGVIGTPSADMIVGGQSAELLNGGGGSDTLDGGAGADTMTGGSGDDVFIVDNAGDRVIEAVSGGADSVTANASWAMASGQEIETLIAGGSAQLSLTGNEGDNSLVGNDAANVLIGLGGADVLTGGGGNDHLFGQSASGGVDGADSLDAGDGSDYLQGNAGNDTLDGGLGSDRINGGANDDVIRGGSDNGNDTINGNLGNDAIDGGAGNDSLRGGQGHDSILGGDGNDVLSGDLGVDTVAGGAGSDLFLFGGNASLFNGAAPDQISDFQDGSDRLSVGYSVQALLVGPEQSSFASAATAAQLLFDGRVGTGGEVAAIRVGNDTYLFYSSNNGAVVDSAVQLVGLGSTALSMADFL